MPAIDLNIHNKPSSSKYFNQFVLELTFDHDDGEVHDTEWVVFPADAQKSAIIEFINFLYAANQHVMQYSTHPKEVEGYDKWCYYSNPGLQGWPTDSNGNYFADLSYITVYFYNEQGVHFDVDIVNQS